MKAGAGQARGGAWWPFGVAVAGFGVAVLATVLLDAFPAEGGLLGVPRGGVAADAVLADVREVVGDGEPRVAGSAAAKAGRDRIATRLEAAGVRVGRATATVPRRGGGMLELENLVAVVPAATPAARGRAPIAVVAHSDSAPRAPGAGDDGSGVAAVLAVARALVAAPPAHDVLLLLTDGEEAGLLGAQAFLHNDPRAGDLRAVVNLDARGAAGPAFVFETGSETGWLAGLMAAHLSRPRTQSLALEAYRRMPNGTDFTVFLRAGLTGFNVAFIGDVGAYHTPDDVPARLRGSTAAHMAQTAIELVRALDAGLPPGGGTIPAGRAVFGDVLGLGILRWPEPWTPAIAAGSALVLLLAGAWGCVRAAAAGARPGRPAAIALGIGAAVPVLAALLAWGLGAAARASGVTMGVAPGRVIGIGVAIWSCAAVLACGAGMLLARRGVTAWPALVGAWGPWCALAVAAAFALPAVALPLVVPVAVVAVAGLLLLAARCPGESAARWASGAGALAVAVLWLPLEPSFLDAFGLALAPFNGVRAGLVMLAFVPLLAFEPRVHGPSDAPA